MVRVWPSGGGGGFGLTMSDDGGFDDGAEFFLAEANCSLNRRTSASNAASLIKSPGQSGHGFGEKFIKSE